MTAYSRIAALAALPLLLLASCSSEEEGAAPVWEPIHTSTHWWMSVYAAAPDDQWIVGGTTAQGSVVHFDGEEVTEVGHGASVGLLNWVHGFESGELVVVGNDGAVLRSDGINWTRDDPPTDQDLWGAWGASPSDVWAVGGNATSGAPIVLRDTGQGFQPVSVPQLERPGVGVFFKVWGSSADDIYIVGQNGAVLHWDGSRLEELHVGISQDLIGVWGTGPDRVVLVGGRRNGAVALWDGTQWRTPDMARFPGMNGVWVDDDSVYVVGDSGAVGTIDFVTGAAQVSAIDTPISLHAVTGVGDTLTAVGGDFSTGPAGPFLGQILIRTKDSG